MDTSKDKEPIINRSCICCGFEIEPIHGGGKDKPWYGMWLDGTIEYVGNYMYPDVDNTQE